MAYIQLTDQYADYLENEDDYVFIPCMWEISETRNEDVEGYELTDEGLELAEHSVRNVGTAHKVLHKVTTPFGTA